jgi:tetratricopeptide (TPR) repeat protein
MNEEEKAEELRLHELDAQIAKYKAGAKEHHEKGMFDNSIEIYQEALYYIDSIEKEFKYKIDEIVVRKCALWNNIAACYKQSQNHDKEIEFSTCVVSNAEHLKNHPNMLFKAHYRRGCAYEKIEKYKLAKKDLQF